MWIESHDSLRNHPKVARLARRLGVSLAAAIGHLHCFWWWAASYAEDGYLSDFDAEEIARAAEWDGPAGLFLEGMMGCGIGSGSGFIDRDEAGDLWVHDWDQYLGALLERRAAERTRKRENARKRRSGHQSESIKVDGDTPSSSSDVDARVDGESRRRSCVQDITVQESNTLGDRSPIERPLPEHHPEPEASPEQASPSEGFRLVPLDAGDGSPGPARCRKELKISTDKAFSEFWSAYPRKTNKAAARRAFDKHFAPVARDRPEANRRFRVLMELLARDREAWRGREERFIPHGSTWLNGQDLAGPPEPAVDEELIAPEAEQAKQVPIEDWG